jgi:hypothetical protein
MAELYQIEPSFAKSNFTSLQIQPVQRARLDEEVKINAPAPWSAS